MTDLFRKKPSALERKLRMIDEELSRVQHDIRVLSRFVAKPEKAGRESLRLKTAAGVLLSPPKKPQAVPREDDSSFPARGVLQKQAPAQVVGTPSHQRSTIDSDHHDGLYAGRLGDYLASSFEASGGAVLRHEQRIIRARAILWFVVAVVIGCLVVRKLIQLYS